MHLLIVICVCECMYVSIWLTACTWDNQTVRVHAVTPYKCARRKAWGSPWPNKALLCRRGAISAKQPYDNQPDKARDEHTALRLQTCMLHPKAFEPRQVSERKCHRQLSLDCDLKWHQNNTDGNSNQDRSEVEHTSLCMHWETLDPGKLSDIEQHPAQHPDPSKKNIQDNFIAC